MYKRDDVGGPFDLIESQGVCPVRKSTGVWRQVR